MDLNCVICLEKIINFSEKKTLQCEHVYHKNCINQVQNNKCPLCKKEIVDGRLRRYQSLYFDMLKQLKVIEIENEKLKKIENVDEDFLKTINDGIAKSIKKNNYAIDMKDHYHIDITNKYTTQTPLCCNHCNLKTAKYGFLYNHINYKHYGKVNNLS